MGSQPSPKATISIGKPMEASEELVLSGGIKETSVWRKQLQKCDSSETVGLKNNLEIKGKNCASLC